MGKINHYSEEAFNATVEINSGLKDAGGHLGTSGQVLSSTGTGTDWITLSANTDNYVDSVSFTKSSSTLSIGRTGALSTFNTVLKSLTGDVVSTLDAPTNSSDALMYYDRFSNNPTGDIPGSTNNANGILTMISHSGPYGKQIGFGDNDDMYIRKFSNNVMGTWRKLVYDANIDSVINNEAGSNNITNIVGLDSGGSLTKRTPSQFISTNQLMTLNGAQTVTGIKTFTSDITANSFIKDGGTSSQFLKADGSVDSSSYAEFDTGTLNNRFFLIYDSATGKARTSIMKVNSTEQQIDIQGGLQVDSVWSEGKIGIYEGNPLFFDDNGDKFEYILTNVNYGAFTNTSGAPQGMMYAASSGGHHFINGEEQGYDNTTWAGEYAPVKAEQFVKEGGTSSQFLKADGSVDSNVYLTSIPSTYVTTNTTQDITGDKRFTSDTVYFGTDASNSAEVIIDTTNGGSPQISFTESNDASWATGVDDTDNSFKIHGTATATVPTINNLTTPIFELTTAGEALINGNKVFHAGNDGSGSGLSADTFRGVSIDSFLRSDVGDSKSGYLKVFGASFTSGTDTATDTAIVQEKGNYLYGDDGTYLRKLLGWATDGTLQIGQNGTSLITDIDLMPGNSGNSAVKVNGNAIWNTGNDSTLVKTNTTQTVSGAKTFSGTTTFSGNTVFSGTTHTFSAGTAKFHGETEILAGNSNPKLRLKRLTGGTAGDDITDITMTDNGLDFIIDNDNDGDAADYRFRRITGGAEQAIALLNNSGFYKYNNGAVAFQVIANDVTVQTGGSISLGYNVASISNAIGCSGWFRSSGSTGWYNGTYGGGVYMNDTTYVRIYNSKKLLVENDAHATNFVLTSDRNLKDKIEPLKVEEIKAEWRTFELKSKPGEKRYGVIAQELLETHPEFVRKDEDAEHYSVAYTDLLIAKVAELEAKNKSLESRLERLESIIENL